MRDCNQGRFQQQFSFLRRQFLQDGDLPFSNILSEEIVAKALTAIDGCWLDRIYTPLVTLWVFLGQVLSEDHSSGIDSLEQRLARYSNVLSESGST